MTKYKVRIEEERPESEIVSGNSYRFNEIYEQVLSDLDIPKVVRFLNGDEACRPVVTMHLQDYVPAGTTDHIDMDDQFFIAS